MACGCGTRRAGNGSAPLSKNPDTPCIFCAHKHIAAAKQLYDLEPGYRDINKSHAIGQLILAAWHYEKTHYNLAMRCRDIWLKIERLEDAGPMLDELQNAAWQLVVAADGKDRDE